MQTEHEPIRFSPVLNWLMDSTQHVVICVTNIALAARWNANDIRKTFVACSES